MPAEHSRPVLYKAWFCPFAQRTYLAMLANGIDFQIIEQDPYDKTPEFLAINPKGLVPVLVHNGKSIVESGILFEYIDEAFPEGQRLLPTDPYERALGRMLLDELNKEVISKFYTSLHSNYLDRSDKFEQKENFIQSFRNFVKKMDNTGPYFLGKNVTMVDLAFLPHAYQLNTVIPKLYDIQIAGKDMERFHTWLDNMLNLKYVSETLPNADKLLERYRLKLESRRAKST